MKLCATILFLCLAARVFGQTSLNVTNYGAVPDGVVFNVSTTSNSPMVSVIGTNVFDASAIGKVLEVFQAGPWTYWSNNPANGVFATNQDTVCLITNVTQGTNLWGTINQGWTRTTYAVEGTNNQQAFQATVNAANLLALAGSNVVILGTNSGIFLMIPPNCMNAGYIAQSYNDAGASVIITNGGLTFLGSTNTIFMGCGAGMLHMMANSAGLPPYGALGQWTPLRGTLFECLGPIANNAAPLVFQNMTFDGGISNGLQSYSYTPNQLSGDGWDTSHHAVSQVNPFPQLQMHQLTEFTNCVFRHWRGEILLCTTGAGGTNTFVDIANCTADDCNATFDNMYWGQHVHGCLITRCTKAFESYQGNTTLPVVWDTTTISNMSPNNNYVGSIVGSITNITSPSFTISNCLFVLSNNSINGISFAPACNVYLLYNTFIMGSGNPLTLTYAGVQPSDGSAASVMTNFWIVGNNFYGGYIYDQGYPIQYMWISNNIGTLLDINTIALANVYINNNTGVDQLHIYNFSFTGVLYGQVPVDETNNNWILPSTYSPDGGAYRSTEYIDYSNGGRTHELQVSTAAFYLQDSNTAVLPPNISMQVLVRTISGQPVTNFYMSAKSPGIPMTLGDNTTNTFYFNSASLAWQTNLITNAASTSAPQLWMILTH